MYNLKTILEASVAGFCETIYTYESLDVEEFCKSVDSLLIEPDVHSVLQEYLMDIAFDVVYIENSYNNFREKRKSLSFDVALFVCRTAFTRTLEIDKTINVEAFVDNVMLSFSEQ